jgi:hypothetical protein
LALMLSASSIMLRAAEPRVDPSMKIVYDLEDSDPVFRQKGVDAIAARMRTDPAGCAEPLALRWWKPLHLAGYDKEVADWTLLATTRTAALPRARTLLSMGKKAEALGTAKSLFNIIRRDKVEVAVLLVEKCLAAAGAADVSEASIGSVQVDDKAYRDWIDQEQSDTFVSHVRRGYRLLLANRTAEARTNFEACLKISKSKEETATLRSLIAKTLRAEDGGFDREDQFVRHPVLTNPSSRPAS